MGCISCGRGFHGECENDDCSDCHPDYERVSKSIVGGRGVGQPLKNPENITDPYSTGRKRAAIQYPLFKTNPCEWRRKKNCGGGLKPIIGCIEGLQSHRHHGPVKNPLENKPGNVHRICTHCHNRWHAENDSIYNELEYSKLVHNPEEATDVELLANEAQWKLRRLTSYDHR